MNNQSLWVSKFLHIESWIVFNIETCISYLFKLGGSVASQIKNMYVEGFILF